MWKNVGKFPGRLFLENGVYFQVSTTDLHLVFRQWAQSSYTYLPKTPWGKQWPLTKALAEPALDEPGPRWIN